MNRILKYYVCANACHIAARFLRWPVDDDSAIYDVFFVRVCTSALPSVIVLRNTITDPSSIRSVTERDSSISVSSLDSE